MSFIKSFIKDATSTTIYKILSVDNSGRTDKVIGCTRDKEYAKKIVKGKGAWGSDGKIETIDGVVDQDGWLYEIVGFDASQGKNDLDKGLALILQHFKNKFEEERQVWIDPVNNRVCVTAGGQKDADELAKGIDLFCVSYEGWLEDWNGYKSAAFSAKF